MRNRGGAMKNVLSKWATYFAIFRWTNICSIRSGLGHPDITDSGTLASEHPIQRIYKQQVSDTFFTTQRFWKRHCGFMHGADNWENGVGGLSCFRHCGRSLVFYFIYCCSKLTTVGRLGDGIGQLASKRVFWISYQTASEFTFWVLFRVWPYLSR